MPIVTKPANGTPQSAQDRTFNWDMQGVYHTASAVIVGSFPGGQNYYPGSAKPAGTYTDLNVSHPGGNKLCWTRVKYQKGTTAWYTDGSTITSFTST